MKSAKVVLNLFKVGDIILSSFPRMSHSVVVCREGKRIQIFTSGDISSSGKCYEDHLHSPKSSRKEGSKKK